MDQHSPGPWQFVQAPERGDGDTAIDGWIHPEGPIVDDEPCVASVNGVGRVDLALILAAPDLLDACERLLRFNEELCADVGVSAHYPSADHARRVIARARGGRI